MLLEECPISRLTSLEVLDLIATDTTNKEGYCLVFVALLVAVFVGAVWCLVNLEAVVPLFVDVYFEVAAFLSWRILNQIDIGSIVIDLGNVDDSEVLEEVLIEEEEHSV